jgi:MFS superfamily sulfate permease-like transporter
VCAARGVWCFTDMWRALWVAPVDFLLMMFTFLVTVVKNVEDGLVWGIVASAVVLIWQISKLDIDSVRGAAGGKRGAPRIILEGGTVIILRPVVSLGWILAIVVIIIITTTIIILMMLTCRALRPRVCQIGQLKLSQSEGKGGPSQFRPVSRYPMAIQNESIKILRLTANLFFGNVSVSDASRGGGSCRGSVYFIRKNSASGSGLLYAGHDPVIK